MPILKDFPEEKAKVIEEYERLSQLFKQNHPSFEKEIKATVDRVIDEAENKKRKSGLLRLQARLNREFT